MPGRYLFLWIAIATLAANVPAGPPPLSDSYHTDHRRTPKLLFLPGEAAAPAADLQQEIESYLKTRAPLFGLPGNLSNLRLDTVQESLLGRHYRYRQFVDDVPVEHGQLVVSITVSGDIYRVFNNTFPQKHSLKSAAARIGSEAALDRAWDHLRVHGTLRVRPRATLLYAPEADGFRLIYKTLTNVRAPDGAWEHRIDAETGDILSVRDVRIIDSRFRSTGHGPQLPDFSSYVGPVQSRKEATARFDRAEAARVAPAGPAAAVVQGSARVFDPDPRTALASDTLLHSSPAAAFDPAYSIRTLRDITLNGSTYSLTGPWVRITDFESPTAAPSTTADGNWTSPRGANAFNDVMVYYHIDAGQRYLQSLGYTNIQNRSIPADTHGFDGEANAAFDPSADSMTFGHGDAAPSPEDAGVILHEYGHAIEFAINNDWGMGGDTGAIGEGFCDYWAASYYYATSNGPSFHPAWCGHWFGNDDGSSPIRRLDQVTARYDSNTTYYAHEPIGGGIVSDELWSTPLFQAFLGLVAQGRPRAEVDCIVLESHYGLPGAVTMREMASAVVETAQRMFPGGPHADVFFDHFATNAILTARPMAPPRLLYPCGGEIFRTNTAVHLQWDPGSAPSQAVAQLEYRMGSDTTVFSDHMDGGVNGWTVSHALGTANWFQTTLNRHSAPTSWTATDLETPTDQYLISPPITLTSNSVLSFWHDYDLEYTGDGGVVEISTQGAGGPWTDLGGLMTQNSYPDYVESWENELFDRPAFTGDSGGFVETLVDLGSYDGATIRLRFRAATDSGNFYGGTGWWIDDVRIVSALPWNPIGTAPTGRTALAWTTPSLPGTNAVVRARLAASGYATTAWDASGDFVISADGDGDGIPDAWESRYYPSLATMSAQTDSDADGASDYAEYWSGTGPTNDQSVLEVEAISRAPDGRILLQWDSVTGRVYRVETSTGLADGFTGVASNVPASPPANLLNDDSATDAVLRVYRVRLESP